jgi:hypothetical protein
MGKEIATANARIELGLEDSWIHGFTTPSAKTFA